MVGLGAGGSGGCSAALPSTALSSPSRGGAAASCGLPSTPPSSALHRHGGNVGSGGALGMTAATAPIAASRLAHGAGRFMRPGSSTASLHFVGSVADCADAEDPDDEERYVIEARLLELSKEYNSTLARKAELDRKAAVPRQPLPRGGCGSAAAPPTTVTLSRDAAPVAGAVACRADPFGGGSAVERPAPQEFAVADISPWHGTQAAVPRNATPATAERGVLHAHSGGTQPCQAEALAVSSTPRAAVTDHQVTISEGGATVTAFMAMAGAAWESLEKRTKALEDKLHEDRLSRVERSVERLERRGHLLHTYSGWSSSSSRRCGAGRAAGPAARSSPPTSQKSAGRSPGRAAERRAGAAQSPAPERSAAMVEPGGLDSAVGTAASEPDATAVSATSDEALQIALPDPEWSGRAAASGLSPDTLKERARLLEDRLIAAEARLDQEAQAAAEASAAAAEAAVRAARSSRSSGAASKLRGKRFSFAVGQTSPHSHAGKGARRLSTDESMPAWGVPPGDGSGAVPGNMSEGGSAPSNSRRISVDLTQVDLQHDAHAEVLLAVPSGGGGGASRKSSSQARVRLSTGESPGWPHGRARSSGGSSGGAPQRRFFQSALPRGSGTGSPANPAALVEQYAPLAPASPTVAATPLPQEPWRQSAPDPPGAAAPGAEGGRGASMDLSWLRASTADASQAPSASGTGAGGGIYETGSRPSGSAAVVAAAGLGGGGKPLELVSSHAAMAAALGLDGAGSDSTVTDLGLGLSDAEVERSLRNSMNSWSAAAGPATTVDAGLPDVSAVVSRLSAPFVVR